MAVPAAHDPDRAHADTSNDACDQRSLVELKVAVASTSLPSSLKASIASKLQDVASAKAPCEAGSCSSPSEGHAAIAATRGLSGPGLAAALAQAVCFAGRNVLDLLLLAPALQEQYLSVNADGSSERRIKFAAEPAAAVAADLVHSERTEGVPPIATAVIGTAQNAEQQGGRATLANGVAPAAQHSLPEQLEAALQRLRKRYPTLQYSAAELSESSSCGAGGPCGAAVDVSVTPSDPDWTHGALSLIGTAHLVQDGEAPEPPGSPRRGPPAQAATGTHKRPDEAVSSTNARASSARERPRRATVPVATGPPVVVELAVAEGGAVDAAVAIMTSKMLQRVVAGASGEFLMLRGMCRRALVLAAVTRSARTNVDTRSRVAARLLQ